MENSRPKRQRAPPAVFVAGPASGRVANPSVEPGRIIPRAIKPSGARAAGGRAARTSTATGAGASAGSAKTGTASSRREKSQSAPTHKGGRAGPGSAAGPPAPTQAKPPKPPKSPALHAPPGFADSMGSPGFGKSPLSAGIMKAAMSPSPSRFQLGSSGHVADSSAEDSESAQMNGRGAWINKLNESSSEEPSRDGYFFNHEDTDGDKADFSGVPFVKPPELPAIASSDGPESAAADDTAEANVQCKPFMEYLAYTDAIAAAPDVEVEQEELCFKCYTPMGVPPAATADTTAGAGGTVPPDTRVYDAQRRRYKCFHAKCLAALPAEKRKKIAASNDPWGGCDTCGESTKLLRCKTCPAAFCSEHVPAYVIGLQSGIVCGICIQRLQAGGNDFQKGAIGRGQSLQLVPKNPSASDPSATAPLAGAGAGAGAAGGGPTTTPEGNITQTLDVKINAEEEPSFAPEDNAEAVPSPSRPKRERKPVKPKEAPGFDGAPQLLSADLKAKVEEERKQHKRTMQSSSGDDSSGDSGDDEGSAGDDSAAGSTTDDAVVATAASDQTIAAADDGNAPADVVAPSIPSMSMDAAAALPGPLEPSSQSKKRKSVPIIKGQIPVEPLGEIVWAKYFKYPWWPSAIPPRPGGNGEGHEKAGKTMVRFLDNMKTGWVPDDKIIPFLEGLDEFGESDQSEAFEQALEIALQATFVGGKIPKELTGVDSDDDVVGGDGYDDDGGDKATGSGRKRNTKALGTHEALARAQEMLADHPLFVDISSDEESEDEFEMTQEEYHSIMGPVINRTWYDPPSPLPAATAAAAAAAATVAVAPVDPIDEPDPAVSHDADKPPEVRQPADTATGRDTTAEQAESDGNMTGSVDDDAVASATPSAPLVDEAAPSSMSDVAAEVPSTADSTTTVEQSAAATAPVAAPATAPVAAPATEPVAAPATEQATAPAPAPASAVASPTSADAEGGADTSPSAAAAAAPVAATTEGLMLPPLPELAPETIDDQVPFDLPRRMCCEMLSHQLDERSPMGRRIAVYWPGDQAWYWGCVTDHRPQDTKFAILYDDGKSEWTDLARKVFILKESTMSAAIDRMSVSDVRSCVGADEVKSGVWQRNTSLLREGREQDIRLFVLYGKTGGTEGIKPPARVDYHDWRDRTLDMSRSVLGVPLYSPRYHEYLKVGVQRPSDPKPKSRRSEGGASGGGSSSSSASSSGGGVVAKLDSTCQKCFEPIIGGKSFISWARAGGHQGQYYHIECRELPWPDSHAFAKGQRPPVKNPRGPNKRKKRGSSDLDSEFVRSPLSKRERKDAARARGSRAQKRDKKRKLSKGRGKAGRRSAGAAVRTKKVLSAECLALREEFHQVMGRRPMGRYQNDEVWLKEMISAAKEGRPATFRERKAAGVKTKRIIGPNSSGGAGGAAAAASDDNDDESSSGEDDESSSGSDSDGDSSSGSESESEPEESPTDKPAQAKRPRTAAPQPQPRRDRSKLPKDPVLAAEVMRLKDEYAQLMGRRPMGRYQNDTKWLRAAIDSATGGQPSSMPTLDDEPAAAAAADATADQSGVLVQSEIPATVSESSSAAAAAQGDDQGSNPDTGEDNSPEQPAASTASSNGLGTATATSAEAVGATSTTAMAASAEAAIETK